MVIFPPIPLIRKRLIIKKLSACQAFSEESAVTFREAGIINPEGFQMITKKLINSRVICRTKENKYYLNRY
ncbi:MAG: hypothetical protein J6A77_09825 [Lachnospiraceae bacterium]|nr:hypothetical protein [Lachnospiraceae bacterium]